MSSGEPMRKTLVSSAYIDVSLDVMDKGRSFVNNINKVGPKTEPCGTPHLATMWFYHVVLKCQDVLRVIFVIYAAI